MSCRTSPSAMALVALASTSITRMLLAPISRRAGGEENKRRAQPLAASRDDVLGHLPYEHDVGVEPPPDHGVHRLHVCGDQVAEKFGLQLGQNGSGRRPTSIAQFF